MLIPWSAVLPEMSRQNPQRVKIATIGVAIGVVGALLGGGLSGPLFQQLGAFPMALILGIPALIAGELTVLGVRERPNVPPAAPNSGFFRAVKGVVADRLVPLPADPGRGLFRFRRQCGKRSGGESGLAGVRAVLSGRPGGVYTVPRGRHQGRDPKPDGAKCARLARQLSFITLLYDN